MTWQLPEWRPMAYRLLAQQIRTRAYADDDANHDLRELAFARWAASTVYPQAVNRWVREIGERA